ncbi:MAG TPA: ECF-type sigma factor [Pirellulaceae bacterium]|nr:ECF-type sigma factor [Pirellulaceae bacterium]
MSDVTELLDAAAGGDRRAAAELLPLVYGELRQLAAARMAAESPGNTLQPTALVHEAYLRLVGPVAGDRWDSRGHFFAAAAEAMRRILVESARRKESLKHGGGRQRADYDVVDSASVERPEELLAVDEALAGLAAVDEQAAELVKLRYFAGMSMPEAAKVMNLPLRSAERLWTFARAWLRRDIERE